jgi:hypothetical protein
MDAGERKGGGWAIWGFAFGYFATYVPYSALTKAMSRGMLPGMPRGLTGFELLPITASASLVTSVLFLVLSGWWRDASRVSLFGRAIPFPTRWTFLSGLCTAAILGSTTLAYTFSGSIVFMMLLMRGGVLVIAPIVDLITGRKVRWASAAALGLSLLALLVAFSGGGTVSLSLPATVDLAVYLGAYFIRLRFMSRLAKSDDPKASRRYFVEEQLVASPAVVLLLVLLASWDSGPLMAQVSWGFAEIAASGVVVAGIIAGICSQGTGLFGGLILLDPRENTFCIPVNRASSVLAGILATGILAGLGYDQAPPGREIAGALLVMAAMVVLAVPAVYGKLRSSRAS